MVSEEAHEPISFLAQERSYWFGDYLESGWKPADSNPDSLLRRFRKNQIRMVYHPEGQDAINCGFCRDQKEYYSLLRNFCIRWTEEEVQRYASSTEARLIRLVLILRDTDLMVGRMSEQIHSWYAMSCACEEGFGKEGSRHKFDPVLALSKTPGGAVSSLCDNLVRIRESRSLLANEIALVAQALLPNCSALTGPLVAARLLAAAGSMGRLSRMSGSGLQIIGARNAFFSHVTSGSSSPKHGLIFEHKRIHTAPKKVRGRVARTLAAQVAIAVRLDFFRKEIDEEFVCRADLRIKKAGEIV